MNKSINIKNLPNYLTISRVLLLPAIWFLMIDNLKGYSLLIFILLLYCGISDFLDGYIARKFNLKSEMGAILDPITDKIVIISCLVLVMAQVKLPILPCLLIILREIIISSLREISLSKGYRLQVSFFGKFKTFFQFITLLVIVLSISLPEFSIISEMMLYISAFFSVLSAIQYFIKFAKALKG